MPPPRDKAKGIICIVLTLLSWASVPLFLKYFVIYIDAWTANGWRYGLSALFWSPVLILGALRGTLPRGIWKRAILPSAFNAVGQTLFAWTPYFIDPGLMAFILRWHILVIALGAYLLFPAERRVIRSGWFWMGILFVGLGSIGTVMLGDEVPRHGSLVGVLMALSAGLFFAGYALGVRWFMHGVKPMVSFAAISTQTSCLLLAAMLLFAREQGAGAMHLKGPQLAMLLSSALIGIAFAHVFYYTSIARLGVAASSGIILLAPFLTALASWVIYHERLTIWQWISGSIALAGSSLILYVQSCVTDTGLPASSEVIAESAPLAASK